MLSHQIVERACHLLSQLPATAPDILEALPFSATALREYTIQLRSTESSSVPVQDSCWNSLLVVHYVNSNVLRIALSAAQFDVSGRRPPFDGTLRATMELLKLSLQISSETNHQDALWSVVCAFLWTSWQRTQMLNLRTLMARQLNGFDYDGIEELNGRGVRTVPEIFKLRSRQQLEELHRTPYLCGWAFRSLHNDRANTAMDLRHFHETYRAYFGGRSPICNPGPVQCDGSSSHACKRFKSTTVTNQSMHDQECGGFCPRLFWDRESFVRVLGAKAVDITNTDTDTLQYCKATQKTLTISHVWSHGQGGRPDGVQPEGTGFNLCLHRRYASLATSFGCDSYWMDTPCIPSEKDLRWECITNITSIFAISKKTIVCDRDIMAIDISNPTIRVYEHVLATLLVCDWSIRAWTLLEGMRGRSGIYLLCLHNRLIGVHELLKSVHNSGRIDLATLFLARAYLFPPVDITNFELFPGNDVSTSKDLEISQGFVSIGEAAALLSHRHATRDADNLLIWSLLIGDLEDESPIEMWKRQVGNTIQTGSLVSSAKRIAGHPGLGWAPLQPTASRRTADHSSLSPKTYPAYDGADTKRGLITAQGLRARWLVHEFPVVVSSAVQERTQELPISSLPNPIAEITTHYLLRYRWGALLQPLPCKGTLQRNIPVPYPESTSPVVVICGSLDQVNWQWKDIYEWDTSTPLPHFVLKDVLLI